MINRDGLYCRIEFLSRSKLKSVVEPVDQSSKATYDIHVVSPEHRNARIYYSIVAMRELNIHDDTQAARTN